MGTVLRRAATAGLATAAGAAAGALWAAGGRGRRVPAPPPIPPDGLPPGRVEVVPGVGEVFLREASPVPGEGETAATADVPTVVLLHGWMFPSDLNWWTCYADLSRFARVIAIDHRGHGRGLRPSEPFRLTDAADDVAAVLRHLEAAPAVVVGYSMGGAIAQLVWRRHPDVVRGLVLAASAASWRASPRMRWGWRAMGVLQVLLRLLPRSVWEDMYEAQARGALPVRITHMISAETPKEISEHLPWILAELDRGSAEDLAEAGRELGRYDARDWLGAVDVPASVLILTGDTLVPESAQSDLADRIPTARRWVIDGDHDAVIAKPQLFVPALVDAVCDVVNRSQQA